ncbi:MAG: hypothetical protein JO345_17090 [Streptosporangiaceae bacterium]|nr:hypothetical protein [Streptosporangiaceae bacterium]
MRSRQSQSIAAKDAEIRSSDLAGAFVYANKDYDASGTLGKAAVGGLG